MAVTAALVKELRQKTGAGMLDCKKALVETDGNIEKAIESLRKKGIAKAEKKAGRVAAEGIVVAVTSDDSKSAVILEFNSETDFVAKNDDFISMANKAANLALNADFTNVSELLEADLDGKTVAQTVTELVARIGENMNIRRFVKATSPEGFVEPYVHLGGKRAVLVSAKGEVTNENKVIAKDVAMHVAAMNPGFLDQSQVTEEVLEKEKEIARAQLEKEGKPANIIEKILIGKMRKYYEENCLKNQKFVKNPDVTIDKYTAGKIELVAYDMLVLGEGIEKEEVNFADEVNQQLGK